MNLAPLIQAAAAYGSRPCKHCDADYRVSRDPVHPVVTDLTIFHEDGCPSLGHRLNRAGRRARRRGQ